MKETRFVDPEQVIREQFANEPFLETYIASLVAYQVYARYPHLRKASHPYVQLAHLIILLLDYLEADPNQPRPRNVD